MSLPAYPEHIAQELQLLQGCLPEWYPSGPYADHLWPLEPLQRREAERLDRLLRRERSVAGERTRERVRRERTRPWTEEERWTLRKRVWRERRDRERELLDQRERTLLDRAEELAQLRQHFDLWLADLRALEPAAAPWCAEFAQLADAEGITPRLLDQLHQRRRRAAERQARALLARSDLCGALAPARLVGLRSPLVVGQALAQLFAAPPFAELAGGMPLAVVIAALALMIARGEGPISVE